MKYKRKPMVVEAFCLKYVVDIPQWFKDALRAGKAHLHPRTGRVTLITSAGTMKPEFGDYILLGKLGDEEQMWSCEATAFHTLYERAEEEEVTP